MGFYPDSSVEVMLAHGENRVVDVELAAVGRGTLNILVSAQPDTTTPIAGAMVYAVLAPGSVHQDTLVAVTDETGWVKIENALEGSYTVSAYAAGYNPASTVRFLEDEELDTGFVLLAPYTGDNKTVSGIVRVQGSGLPIGNAEITIRAGLYVITAYSVTNGDYSISFPSTFSDVEFLVTADGHLPLDTVLNVTTSTLSLNVNLEAATGLVGAAAVRHAPVSRVTASGRNMLSVRSASGGVLSLFALDGKLVYRKTVSAGETVISLAGKNGRMLVAELVGGGQVLRTAVTLR